MFLRRRTVALVLLLLTVAGCASAQPTPTIEDDARLSAETHCKAARYPDDATYQQCYRALLGHNLQAAKMIAAGRVSAATRAIGKTSVKAAVRGTAAFVPVAVNGGQPAMMLVDTGASSTILSPALAERIGLAVPPDARRVTVRVAGGATLSIPFVPVESIRVGDLTVERLEVGVYDVLPHAKGVFGVLGTDFMQHFRTSLDQASSSLSLEVRTLASAVPGEPVPMPQWTVGDEWAFRVEQPNAVRSWILAVTGVETIGGTGFWALTSGGRHYYYRRDDLALLMEKVGTETDRQYRPMTQHWLWPLSVGQIWDDAYVIERPGRPKAFRALVATVEAEEDVRVPAGTFRSFRIVRRYKANGRVSTESWYAPAVKFWVRYHEHLSTGIQRRELTAYKVQ